MTDATKDLTLTEIMNNATRADAANALQQLLLNAGAIRNDNRLPPDFYSGSSFQPSMPMPSITSPSITTAAAYSVSDVDVKRIEKKLDALIKVVSNLVEELRAERS